MELVALSDRFTESKDLNKVLNLLTKHFCLIGMGLFVEAANFGSVDLVVLVVAVSDELALGFCDFLLSLRRVELTGLWLMVVLQFCPVKHPSVGRVST